MRISQLQDAIEQSGIEDWGAGYFSIDRGGHVVCTPKGYDHTAISLHEVVDLAKSKGLSTPMIIRFPQLIKGQLERMDTAFKSAIREFNYSGSYAGVFPFKVNQRREFIDAIVECGLDMDWGLEVGSKPEFMAALSYSMSPKALLICNGFKDSEFIDMAFDAASMGRNVILVLEGPDELHKITAKFRENPEALKQNISIGLRIRLYSRGSGKWKNSSGEQSKFGLTTVELMHVLRIMTEEKLQDKLTMLHFHMGSQIAAIRRFKNALREAARVYAKVVKVGFAPQHLNIGGGVGVDYDGSQTSAQSSANYNLQEFANDAVYLVGEICKNEMVPCPNIITESGRVIAAYHSVVVTDIREVQGEEAISLLTHFSEAEIKELHKNIIELRYILNNISSKNFGEFFHDAEEFYEDLFALFNLGYLNLKERAVAEELFHKICLKTLQFSSFQRHPSEEFAALQKLKVAKYLANFSIFQSIPDAWSIDQLFPVLPLSRHNENPTHKATIVDITCDSDGCIDRFVDKRKEKSELDLHRPNGAPYYIGFFLVGAYQESLASEHNLFGAINEVEVTLDDADSWTISKITYGDPIIELLVCRNYNEDELKSSYGLQINRAVEAGLLKPEERGPLFDRLCKALELYPYLKN